MSIVFKSWTISKLSLSSPVKLKENIMFIYQVMLHDPLYDWSVGPSKAAAKQAGEWEKLKKQEDGQGNR